MGKNYKAKPANSGKVKQTRNNQRNNAKKPNNYLSDDYGLNTSSGQVPDIVTRVTKKDNDASWYMHVPGMPADFGNLSFSQALGLGQYYLRQGQSWSTTSTGPMTFIAPGICQIKFTPTIGQNANGPKAAINMAAQQLYTLVRTQISAPKNYDKTDLMMLIMAMDSAYMIYEMLLRAYRTIGMINDRNRYVPETILRAQDIDISVKKQLAEFRGVLDSFAYDLANVNIPDQFSIIERHSWMCSNVYLDDDSDFAQMYVMMPDSYYVWTEGSKDPTTGDPVTPNFLKRVTFSGVPLKLQDIKDLIDSIMKPILGSQNVGDMSGDMRKAFGDAGMIKIHPVEDYAVLQPVYSAEVLMQIRNIFCTISKITPTPTATGNIEQELSNLQAGPYLKQSFTMSAASADGGHRRAIKPILNFINEDATLENVLVATRLMCLSAAPSSGGIANVSIYGTEFVTGINFWTLTTDGLISGIPYDQDLSVNLNSPSGSTQAGNWKKIAQKANFNNAPAGYIFSFAKDSAGLYTEQNLLGIDTNLCKYMFLDDNALMNMHETAVLSLFACKDYKLNR
nr:capsid protein [Rat picobirnavirus]